MKKFLLFAILIISQEFYCQEDVFSISRNGTSKEMELYLSKNPKSIENRNENGFTPLILASYRGNISVVKILLENGASINAKSDMGTALMASAVKGNIEITQFLLEKKADPNIADTNGNTALIYAVQFQNIAILKLLLDFKADKLLKDKSGKTAFEYAVFSGNELLINLLK